MRLLVPVCSVAVVVGLLSAMIVKFSAKVTAPEYLGYALSSQLPLLPLHQETSAVFHW